MKMENLWIPRKFQKRESETSLEIGRYNENVISCRAVCLEKLFDKQKEINQEKIEFHLYGVPVDWSFLNEFKSFFKL